LTAWAGYQIVCIYISGIGWKEMNEALRETKAERLMISYVGPHKRNRSVNQYPNFNFRHPNVIKSIDAVLNQFVVATDFSLEWLLKELIFMKEDDLRMTDQVCSPYSLETFLGRKIVHTGEGSGSEYSEDDLEGNFSDSSDSNGPHEYQDDSDSDSYSAGSNSEVNYDLSSGSGSVGDYDSDSG
jgi:hypothetical protein